MLRRGFFVLIIFVISMMCCSKGKQKGEIAIEGWPGEGIPVIAWTGSENSLALFSDPGDKQPSGYLAVQKDQHLQWDRSLILVKKLGRLKILEDCIMTGYIYDSIENEKLVGGKTGGINLSSGTILDVVCYAAEGDYIFRYQKKYVETSASLECQQLLLAPRTQWWIRLIRNGRHLGWVKVDAEKIAVVDRKF